MNLENWREILTESINSFDENELAFLALQGKIELQLRDKIAWCLEKKSRGEYYVKREYGITGRKKCDLAILNKDMLPLCLVEFKAHSASIHEDKYYTYCYDDCQKMEEIAVSASSTPEMYYIFFQTQQEGKMPTTRRLIAYYDLIKKCLMYNGMIESQWDEYKKCGDFITYKREIGEYYGLRLTIHAMILQHK